MPTSDVAPLGLRERKRAATRHAIQLATITLVRERGLDALTVDEIARVADIAPRTFFNYFPSKDAAVAGEMPGLPSEEHVDVFIAARGHLLADLAELLSHVADESLGDRRIVKLRREIIKDHPQLSALRMASLRHFEGDLIEVVQRRLDSERADRADRTGGRAGSADRARLVTFLAMGALRTAWMRWADGAEDDLAGILREVVDEARDVLGS